jgi:hypothetical protein
MKEKDYARAIPARILGSINAYVRTGRPVGDFVYSVLTNNLKESLFLADPESLAALPVIVRYLYHRVPSSCWVSKENVASWMEKGGAEGQKDRQFEIDLIDPG